MYRLCVSCVSRRVSVAFILQNLSWGFHFHRLSRNSSSIVTSPRPSGKPFLIAKRPFSPAPQKIVSYREKSVCVGSPVNPLPIHFNTRPVFGEPFFLFENERKRDRGGVNVKNKNELHDFFILYFLVPNFNVNGLPHTDVWRRGPRKCGYSLQFCAGTQCLAQWTEGK